MSEYPSDCEVREYTQPSVDDLSVSRSVSFTFKLLRRVDDFCRKRNLDRSNVIKVALEKYLDQKEEEQKK